MQFHRRLSIIFIIGPVVNPTTEGKIRQFLPTRRCQFTGSKNTRKQLIVIVWGIYSTTSGKLPRTHKSVAHTDIIQHLPHLYSLVTDAHICSEQQCAEPQKLWQLKARYDTLVSLFPSLLWMLSYTFQVQPVSPTGKSVFFKDLIGSKSKPTCVTPRWTLSWLPNSTTLIIFIFPLVIITYISLFNSA